MRLFQYAALAVALAISPVLTGCAGGPNRTAYQTVGVVGVSVDTAMHFWAAYTTNNKVAADQIQTVKRAYLIYQSSFNAMIDAGEALAENTNKDTSILEATMRATLSAKENLLSLICQFLPTEQANLLKGAK